MASGLAYRCLCGGLLLSYLWATCTAQDAGEGSPGSSTSLHSTSLLPDGTVRLRDGFQAYQGRVEVYYDGNWGTVCDPGWNTNAAIVLCRQLGYDAVRTPRTRFGEASGPLFLRGLDCAGSEDTLVECNRAGWVVDDGSCGHEQDVGVVCQTADEDTEEPPSEAVDGSLRLADGTASNNGRVEVYYQGQWGTVCQEKPDDLTVHVVCRQLGYITANPPEAVPPGGYGPGTGPVWLSSVACRGMESKLAFCAHDRWGENGCEHDSDLMVSCKTYVEPTDGDVRLTWGPNFQSGQVEIFYQGVWGTVCDEEWTIKDATVVCRQLDFKPARASMSYGHYLTVNGVDPTNPVFFDSVACEGDEKRLEECAHTWRAGVCDHIMDVGVICGAPEEWKPVMHEDDGRVRLAGGTYSHNGRVEIKYQGQWGTVCDNGWGTPEAANVVCRQLGYPSAETALPKAFFGEGYKGIILDRVSCEGTESGLAFCDHAAWNENDCEHAQDVSVVCTAEAPDGATPDGTIRLVGKEAPLKGRLEVYYQNVWATVCGHGWTPASSDVVCQQLGYPGADPAQPHFNAPAPDEGTPILLSTVACSGVEAALLDCPHLFAFVADECSHDLDLGVACSLPTTTSRPETTTTAAATTPPAPAAAAEPTAATTATAAAAAAAATTATASTATATTTAQSSPTTQKAVVISPKGSTEGTIEADDDGASGEASGEDEEGDGDGPQEGEPGGLNEDKSMTAAPTKRPGVLSTIWVIIILILMVPAILLIFILGLVIKRRMSRNSYKAVNQSSMPMSQRV